MTTKQKSMIILPICLLLFKAFEEVVEYKLPEYILNPYLLTAVVIFLCSVGFVIIDDLVTPWIASLIEHGHKNSKKQGGSAGVLVFYIATFIAIFIIYYIMLNKGPQFLLPKEWR